MTRKYTSLPYTEYPVAIGNFDISRKPIDRIVLHHTVSTYSGAIAWFGSTKAGTSAHYIVSNKGEIAALLEEYYTAYHSGNYVMNQRSIGIETEWYSGMTRTDKLYNTVGKLVADIAKYYNISLDRTHIIKHNEVVATQCPGTLDVDRVIAVAKSINNSNSNMDKTICYTPQENDNIIKALDVQKQVGEKYIGKTDGTAGEIITKIENTIAGHKTQVSRAQSAEQEARTSLARAQAEVKNRIEQVSRLKQDLLKQAELYEKRIVELQKKYENGDEYQSELEAQHKELMTKYSDAMKRVGALEIENAELTESLEIMKKTSTQMMTAGEALAVMLEAILARRF